MNNDIVHSEKTKKKTWKDNYPKGSKIAPALPIIFRRWPFSFTAKSLPVNPSHDQKAI